MARMLIAVVPILMTTFGLNGWAAGEPPPSPVLETTVVAHGPEQAIVALAVGRDAGVAVGDYFWVFDDADVAGVGTVYFVTGKQSVGRLAGPFGPGDSGGRIPTGRPAVVFREPALSALRDRLGPGVTVRGRVARVPPGRRTAWLDIGRRAGLSSADHVLVYRNGIPIARARVDILHDQVALASLTPLVGNALTQPGDAAELWPAPAVRRQGRLNSTVLKVTPGNEGPTVLIVGTTDDGLVEGRLVDLYRKGKYVGVASLSKVSEPLSEARVIESASPQAPAVGDLALVRAGPDHVGKPLSAAIFRIEGDYCLLAAGESDGVQEDEKFMVRRADPAHAGVWREIAELTIRTVKVDYAGAYIRPLVADGARLARWDIAERRAAEQPVWRPIGTIETVHVGSRSVMARIDAPSGMTPGHVVRWVPAGNGPPAGAIVLRYLDEQAILYVPPGWGDLHDGAGARIEAVWDRSAGLPTHRQHRVPTRTSPSR